MFSGDEDKGFEKFQNLQTERNPGGREKISKTTVSDITELYYEEDNIDVKEIDSTLIASTVFSDSDDINNSLDIPTISVPDYQDHLGLAVGVLVTVIVMLIVAILGILYKNYQYARQKHWLDSSHYSGQPQTTGYSQQGGLIYNQTSEEVYPLYPSYHNSTISSMSVPYDPPSHYATADLLHFSHNNYGKSQPVGV